MKNVFLLFVGIVLTSCSATKVFMDYDENADIESYKTYNYYFVEKTGLNELDEKRIIRALDSLLPQKGFTQKTIPDFNINFYVEKYSVESRNSIGIGLGGGGGAIGGGVSGGIPINTSKDMVAFTLEFFDALNKELFWQAVVEVRFKNNENPNQRQAFFNELVKKALEKYPPEK